MALNIITLVRLCYVNTEIELGLWSFNANRGIIGKKLTVAKHVIGCNLVFPNNITEALLKMAINIITLMSNTDSDDLNAGVPKGSVLKP
jgi:hypothetical protein